MLLDIAAALAVDVGSSWMLGDSDTDVQAARAAGCRAVLIEYAGSRHRRAGDAAPDLLAADLPDGVARMLDHGGG
jgi:phosphoglycolate phosphatase-like HAD superfamily hydrolase